MDDVKPMQWASAKANLQFICVTAYSGYRSSAADSAAAQHVLPPDADHEALGAAVLDALDHSRFLTLDEIDVFFDYRLVAQRYHAWVRSLMERFGYKTKKAMFTGMNSCAIERRDGRIVISPSNHEKLEAWSGGGIAPEDHVSIPADSLPAAVGAALRLALSRCI